MFINWKLPVRCRRLPLQPRERDGWLWQLSMNMQKWTSAQYLVTRFGGVLRNNRLMGFKDAMITSDGPSYSTRSPSEWTRSEWNKTKTAGRVDLAFSGLILRCKVTIIVRIFQRPVRGVAWLYCVSEHNSDYRWQHGARVSVANVTIAL